MSMQMLTEARKWQAVTEKFTHGLSGAKKRNMARVLENTRRGLLKEAATPGATAAGNIAALNKVILPIIRRVMPTVIANEIMGVQPMEGPVGQIHTLRVSYAETIPTAGTGVIAGAEALSPFNVEKYYSGNEDVVTPAGANTSALEGRMGNKIRVAVLKKTVEAKSRRLSAVWTVESMQDAQSQHGLDIEAELMAAIAQEITVEIDQEMLFKLRGLAGPATATYDQTSLSGVAASVVDEHAALMVMMNWQSNRISQRTRRGPANWGVVSSDALTVLQSAQASAFAKTTEGSLDAPTNVKYVGTLNNSVKIYSDSYATNSEAVLIGYKGDSEFDAAAYYCPYIPLMSSGTVLNPDTGEHTTTFLTRYGYLEFTSTADSLGNSSDYLSKIAMSNLKFS